MSHPWDEYMPQKALCIIIKCIFIEIVNNNTDGFSALSGTGNNMRVNIDMIFHLVL